MSATKGRTRAEEEEQEKIYDEDKLIKDISESLALILRKSPNPDFVTRCFDRVQVKAVDKNEKEEKFKATIQKKLRPIFRLTRRPGDSPAPVLKSRKRRRQEKQQQGSGVKEEEEEDEDDWRDSDDDYRSSTDFHETDPYQSEGDTFVPNWSASREIARSGWSTPPLHLGRSGSPAPLSTFPIPPSISHRGGSPYPSPTKIRRIEYSQTTTTGDSDWNSDDPSRRGVTPDPSSQHTSRFGQVARSFSPSPSPPTGRRILGELPLEKDEFDSESDDEVSRVFALHNHSPTAAAASPNRFAANLSSPRRSSDWTTASDEESLLNTPNRSSISAPNRPLATAPPPNLAIFPEPLLPYRRVENDENALQSTVNHAPSQQTHSSLLSGSNHPSAAVPAVSNPPMRPEWAGLNENPPQDTIQRDTPPPCHSRSVFSAFTLDTSPSPSLLMEGSNVFTRSTAPPSTDPIASSFPRSSAPIPPPFPDGEDDDKEFDSDSDEL